MMLIDFRVYLIEHLPRHYPLKLNLLGIYSPQLAALTKKHVFLLMDTPSACGGVVHFLTLVLNLKLEITTSFSAAGAHALAAYILISTGFEV